MNHTHSATPTCPIQSTDQLIHWIEFLADLNIKKDTRERRYILHCAANKKYHRFNRDQDKSVLLECDLGGAGYELMRIKCINGSYNF